MRVECSNLATFYPITQQFQVVHPFEKLFSALKLKALSGLRGGMALTKNILHILLYIVHKILIIFYFTETVPVDTYYIVVYVKF